MRNRWRLVLLLLTICLLALRLWHIRADFPDYHFYSQDTARFTDEGFYTSAALQHFTLGTAYIPGGWNPGVFMPVWPLMVGLLFHFTGISVTIARSLAVTCTWLSVLLACAVTRQYRSKSFACVVAFLIAANALGFFFGRLALLEPAFVMFLLLAIYLAGRVRPGNYLLAILVGVAFTLMTLTKTTGPFVLPAILYPIWAGNREANGSTSGWDSWKLMATALATILVLLGSAKLIWFLHFNSDAKIILAVSPLWQLENSPPRLLRFFFRGTWVDPVLFPLAVAAFVAASVRVRSLWRDTLFTTAFLWETGYAAFIVFHYDGPPRYFVAVIVPTIWLAMIFTEWLWRQHRRIAIPILVCIAASVAWNIASVGDYLIHPQYSLVDASLGIKKMIAAQHQLNPATNELLIGRGADEISLLSGGFPAMDSDGAMPLAQKVNVYDPDWFMTWTHEPTLRRDEVASERRMVIRATFPDLDRANRAGIVLYQLFPKNSR